MVVGDEAVSILVRSGGKIQALKCWQIAGADPSNSIPEHELRRILGAEKVLDIAIGSKVCALSVPTVTLVPKRLFSSNELEKYFRLLVNPGVKYTYEYTHIPGIDAYLVWATEHYLHQLLSPYFKPNQFTHLAASLIQNLSDQSPTDHFAVYGNIRNQRLQLLVYDRQQLVFYNSFAFEKPADLLYYILLIYKQFDLKPTNLPLQLSGTLLEDSEIYKLLFRYFKSIQFLKPAKGFILSENAKSLPEHFWFDITTI